MGIAYNIKQTSTVLRVSYARTLETPFNENLVLSSQGCSNPVLNPLLACSRRTGRVSETWSRASATSSMPVCSRPLANMLWSSGEYIWKYTHNAFDFSVLGNTPITFPIDWHNSKIPGFALRAEVPETSTASPRML